MINGVKGYATIVDPSAPIIEYDTISCCHCGCVIFVKPGTINRVYLISIGPGQWKEEPGAACYRCGLRPVCLACDDNGECVPFEWWLEKIEKQILG